MQYTIKNTYLSLTIDTLGAQMISIKNAAKEELLWQGDSKIWGDRAPILFPYAGRIRNGEFFLDGARYSAPTHGFMHSVEHPMVLKEDNLIIFEYNSCPQSKELFPFDFSFRTSFILSGHSIHHKIEIVNLDKRSFGFGLGFHPGFNLPFDKIHKTSDYFLEFDRPQSPTVLTLDKDVLMDGKSYSYGENITTIPLHDKFFNDDSLVLSGLDAKFLSLVEKDTGKRIEIDIQDFPYVVLWSVPTPQMKFFCIEPWLTLPDRFDAHTEWDKKEHYAAIENGNSFSILNRMRFTR